jgi:hypothetical protein
MRCALLVTRECTGELDMADRRCAAKMQRHGGKALLPRRLQEHNLPGLQDENLEPRRGTNLHWVGIGVWVSLWLDAVGF